VFYKLVFLKNGRGRMLIGGTFQRQAGAAARATPSQSPCAAEHRPPRGFSECDGGVAVPDQPWVVLWSAGALTDWGRRH
jgi:hypothetical protein